MIIELLDFCAPSFLPTTSKKRLGRWPSQKGRISHSEPFFFIAIKIIQQKMALLPPLPFRGQFFQSNFYVIKDRSADLYVALNATNEWNDRIYWTRDLNEAKWFSTWTQATVFADDYFIHNKIVMRIRAPPHRPGSAGPQRFIGPRRGRPY